MKNSLFKSRPAASGDMSLNITAMADIFTIILVFLVKSFFTGSMSITPAQGIVLPQAFAETPHIEALKIEVAESTVIVDDQPVSTLSSFQFSKRDIHQTGVSSQLLDAIKIARKRQQIIAQANPDVKADHKVMILAHQDVPYSTIKVVLASAAAAGYTDYKLAVVQAN